MASILGTILAASILTAPTEEDACQRVYAHLVLSDTASALKEGKRALHSYPDSKKVKMAYVSALAAQGDEFSSMQVWSKIPEFSLTDPIDRKMLETLSWGVLRQADASSQIFVRLNALVGAALTHDAKALPMLLSHLRSSNATLRAFSVQMAAQFGDQPLKKEIARLLKEEKVWYVRLAVIEAVGRLRLYDLRSDLQEIIASSRAFPEEKAAAITALVSMYERVDPQELQSLAKSPRAGLRSLCAELIHRFEMKEQLPLLYELLTDTSSDVRRAALHTLSFLRPPNIEKAKPLLQDPSSEVALTAAHLLLLYNDKDAFLLLQKALHSELQEERLFASAAIASSGRYGIQLAQEELFNSRDPFVTINLARALLGQQTEVIRAATAIHQALQVQDKTLWMWKEYPLSSFRTLAPTEVGYREGIANYPLVVDQLSRLELLSMLSVVGYEGAQDAVREFLHTRSWAVSAGAATLVLREGTEEDLEAVRALLTDKDEKIRCLAALILAAVGKDPSAVPILQSVYPQLDREMKLHVLQALAHVGDPSSVPFLLQQLQEPFQLLRVASASALIQCLYH